MNRLQKALTALALAVAAGTASLGPAHADVVDGNFNFRPNWGDEHTLSTGSFNVGNNVGMWQAFLSAEALFPSRCSQDGAYGSGTANATRSFQSRYGLGVDGIVGSATWNRANARVTRYYTGIDAETYDYLYYVGQEGRQVFLANYNKITEGEWRWRAYGYSDAVGLAANYADTNHPTVNFVRPSGC